MDNWGEGFSLLLNSVLSGPPRSSIASPASPVPPELLLGPVIGVVDGLDVSQSSLKFSTSSESPEAVAEDEKRGGSWRISPASAPVYVGACPL